MKVTAKKLIFFHLYIDIFARSLRSIFSALTFVGYIPDLINVLLIPFLIKKYHKNKRILSMRSLVGSVTILLLFDIVMFMVRGESILLLIWGLRNQYRFLIFLIECATLLDRSDLPKLEKIFLNCFYVNIVAITIEFIFGYKRDLLGGTFGLDHSCNGIVNIFICMIAAYAILGFLHKMMPAKKAIILLMGCFYWTSLAEIKAFYIEIVILTFVAICIVKGKSMKKMTLVLGGAFTLLASITLLIFIFPDQTQVFVRGGFLSYARNINAGIHGFGRMTAIPIINKTFFDNNIWLKLFGIGLGNGDMVDIGPLKYASDFYNSYVAYGYTTLYYAFVYVERGVVGIMWYLWLFLYIIKKSYAALKRKEDIVVNEFVIMCVVCFIISTVYGDVLKTSTGGFFAFLVMAIPYIIGKMRNTEE